MHKLSKNSATSLAVSASKGRGIAPFSTGHKNPDNLSYVISPSWLQADFGNQSGFSARLVSAHFTELLAPPAPLLHQEAGIEGFSADFSLGHF